MKKIITLICVGSFAINSFAQDVRQYNTNRKDSTNGKDSAQTYCIYKKENGKMCVKKEEQEITTAVSLSDGSILKPDGMLTKKDGTEKILKEGECVNKNGNVSKSEKNKIQKTSSNY